MVNTYQTYIELPSDCENPNLAFVLRELEKVNQPSDNNIPITTLYG